MTRATTLRLGLALALLLTPVHAVRAQEEGAVTEEMQADTSPSIPT